MTRANEVQKVINEVVYPEITKSETVKDYVLKDNSPIFIGTKKVNLEMLLMALGKRGELIFTTFFIDGMRINIDDDRSYEFDWHLNKPYNEQSTETQTAIERIFLT